MLSYFTSSATALQQQKTAASKKAAGQLVFALKN
jgi:hypothetical protein